MSPFEDFSPWALLCFDRLWGKFSFSMLSVSQFLSNSSCSSSDSDDTCRDDSAALTLKLIAIGSILVAGLTGVTIPLLGSRNRSGPFSSESNFFVATKAFAAGVILATGLVHMLPDASSNLSSSCLPTYPWSKFPFAGFVAMCSALLTLVADLVGTQIYDSNNNDKNINKLGGDENVAKISNDLENNGTIGSQHDEDDDSHSHLHSHSHSHSHSYRDGQDDGARKAVVSQVLELGIVSHSVIIGLSIGVSHSPCVIRPLVAALSFHQFFEGFALGGCISEARFKTLKAILMASFFALTTPTGVAIGISISAFYDSDTALALVVEGLLDSVSAGILIYMSLVDLIAADFMSNKMRSNCKLQMASYFALFLGAIMMSSLAVWS